MSWHFMSASARLVPSCLSLIPSLILWGGLSCVEAPEFEESLAVVDSKSSDPNINSNLLLNLAGGMVS